jgi:hypothetical protein
MTGDKFLDRLVVPLIDRVTDQMAKGYRRMLAES